MAVDAVEVEGDPADAPLGEGDSQVGEAPQGRAEQQILGGDGADLAGEHHEVVDGGLPGPIDDVEAGADVQAKDHVLVAQGLKHGVPVAGEEAGVALHVGRLEEADGPAALLAHPAYLPGGERHVPHGDEAEGNEPARVGRAPLVDGPVVVGLEHHEGQILVVGLGEGPGVPAGHGRKAHRGQDAVGVHVPHPLVDVEATGPQLGVGAGVEAPLLGGPAHGGGHAERR